MKEIKRIICVIIFLALFVFTALGLRYLLYDDVDSYTRRTYHEMYEQDNIDVIFVGSSHCYRSFKPSVFDKEFGLNTFNLGSSGQYLDGSLMLIKEAAKYNDIKKIYLEMYYAIPMCENDRTMIPTYIVSDYIRPSFEREKYLFLASDQDNYINSFISARRSWKKLFDIDFIIDLLKRKNTPKYKNYEYDDFEEGQIGEFYVGKGYVTNNNRAVTYFEQRNPNYLEIENIPEKWKSELKDIIEFCQKKNIELTLVSAPMPNYTIACEKYCDEYNSIIRDIISDTNIKYYDFNLCKPELFSGKAELFNDVDHLNDYGAEIFSHLLADVVNGKIDIDESFYSSYEEKFLAAKPEVYGISFIEDTENDETIRKCEVISSNPDKIECEVSILTENGDEYGVKDMSTDPFFQIYPGLKGEFTVKYRDSENPTINKEVKILLAY